MPTGQPQRPSESSPPQYRAWTRTLRSWRHAKGYSPGQAARYLGIGLRDYYVLESQGVLLVNAPVRTDPVNPV